MTPRKYDVSATLNRISKTAMIKPTPCQEMESDTLQLLVRDVLSYYESEVRDSPYANCIVQPSLPVLFFGDYQAYNDSDLKIVTVGSNPSLNEFRLPPGEKPRFPIDPPADIEAYVKALSAYFYPESNPYRKWFDRGYEKVLRKFDAGYYPAECYTDKKTNTATRCALHTDLFSPLATDPVWSKLDRDCASRFAAAGNDFWQRLIDILQPDLVLASVARPHFQQNIRFPRTMIDCRMIADRANGLQRRNPYTLERWQITLSSGKKTVLIWGRKQVMPFQGLGDIQKNEIRGLYDQPFPISPAST